MKYKAIAIEREYGSGGTEIGEKLAAQLRIPFYGRAILEMAAQKMNLSISQLEYLEETTTSSFLYSIYAMSHLTSGDTSLLTKEQELSMVETGIIKHLVMDHPCVIVGRCSAGVFRDNNDVLKVFIRSSFASRKKRAVEIYGDEENKAESKLTRLNKRRREYYKATSGRDWQDPSSYHMILDSGKLGINGVIEILYNCVTGDRKPK